jgi:hypothetical protein
MIQWGTTLDDYATYQLAKGLAHRTIQNRHECMMLLARETEKTPGEISKQDLLIRLSRDITPFVEATRTLLLPVLLRIPPG